MIVIRLGQHWNSRSRTGTIHRIQSMATAWQGRASPIFSRAWNSPPKRSSPTDKGRLTARVEAMDVLAVITARGGSTILPRKNILPFCGKPMIAYSIEAALNARHAGAPIDRVIVSTDDAEIADI